MPHKTIQKFLHLSRHLNYHVVMDHDYSDDFDGDDLWEDSLDESFEWESSMASAGWGTDEDYGYYGGDDWGE